MDSKKSSYTVNNFSDSIPPPFPSAPPPIKEADKNKLEETNYVDGVEKSHCLQISKRKDAYQRKILTEKGLIELGSKIGIKNLESKQKKDKYLYYSQQVNHLDKWNYDNQIKDVAKISLHAKNACRTQSLKNMIGNIEGQYYKMMTLFHYLNEIRKINIHRENDLKEELKLSNDSSNEFEEMCDNYINELDENENKIKELNSSLVTLKGQLKLFEADKKWLEDSYKNKINRIHILYYLTNAFIAFLLVYLNYGM